MTRASRSRRSRRSLMYAIVGIQVLVLAAIVASQEVNRALDSGAVVELEISQAHARTDPFRGAAVSGLPVLDLDGKNATLPAERLQPGKKVLVFFRMEPGRRPRITRVERKGWGAGPMFSVDTFSIPGRVRGEAWRRSLGDGGRGLIARIGKPPVPVELDLPASIPIDAAALAQLSGPSLVRATLRRGFLGHRYLTDVRLAGLGWTHEIGFAYDEARDRLMVLAPRQERPDRRRISADQKSRSDVLFFEGAGKEAGSAEVAGRLVEGVAHPAGGSLWALITEEAWGHSTVQLAQIREGGQVAQRGPQIAYDRIVGFDLGEGALWVLEGPPGSSRLQAPFSVNRLTLQGFQGPRLGPFASRPKAVIARGQQVWVLEPEQHRVIRLDRTGRVEREYREVNRPTDIAVDEQGLILIEANQTQLSRFSLDGQVIWRVPRFQGLAWILPEGGAGGGWVAAQRFEGGEGGVFRYDSNGKISRLPASVTPRASGEWNRGRFAPDAIQTAKHGRLYVREVQAIVILDMEGALLNRVDAFRYAKEQPARS